MPKRKSVKKVETGEVQGDGSYVTITQLKVKDIREMRERAAEEGLDMFEVGLKLLGEQVIGWNWVDEDGNPLPQVPEDKSVINELTEEEATFIVNILIGAEEAKN